MYEVIESFNLRELEKNVNDKIKEWYVPSWSLQIVAKWAINLYSYYQAIYKDISYDDVSR